MRLNEILENSFTDEVVDALNLIERDCKPYLNDLPKGKHLYRGIQDLDTNNTRVSFTKLQVRQSRAPRDTRQIEHEIVDKIMKEVGLVATRSNSIFTQASPDGLKDYGEVYLVFPIGEYHISWSPEIKDWTEDGILHKFMKAGKNKWDLQSTDDIDMPRFTRWIDSHYGQGDLASAMLDPMMEIMVNCKEYYALLYQNRLNQPGLWDYQMFKDII